MQGLRDLDALLGRSWMLLCVPLLFACGGSGSSRSSFDAEAQLLSVRFPDPLDVNVEDEGEAPLTSPLIQTIRFEFDGRPNPDRVSTETIQIRDPVGLVVAGRFVVEERSITFIPRFPLREPSPTEGGEWDGGGAGLEPATTYTIRIGAATWSFVRDVASDLLERYADPTDPRGVALAFSTTNEPDDFFRGIEIRRPNLVSTSPRDGAVDVTPQLYSDPEARFAPRGPFRLTFDGPISPAADHLALFRVVDLHDSDYPGGLTLATENRVIENSLDTSIVEVWPCGILPLGHLHLLEIPESVLGLAEDRGTSDETMVAATFTTAGGERLARDVLIEDFDDNVRHEQDPEVIGDQELPALWNDFGSGVLEAAFAFPGDGVLGRFVPHPPTGEEETRTIVLDTTRQVFPLWDGSTPDAPSGYVVERGMFHFTDIHIPSGVVLEFLGSSPPILTATGTVTIEGTIDLDGTDGIDENAFDSAVTSISGGLAGPGGGRGGEAHPIVYWPPDVVSLSNAISPNAGGDGWGAGNVERTGGQGGQSGLMDHRDDDGDFGTDREISCVEGPGNNNGDHAAGGSGGSYLYQGRIGRDGIGNVIPDGQGRWILRTKKEHGDRWNVLEPGAPGLSPFRDADDSNDFIGVTGEIQTTLGGQGGGAGGSRTEAYYCGSWCKDDGDRGNNKVCKGGEFYDGSPDSAGDARGGSGGGGGGALTIQALKAIRLASSAHIHAIGGDDAGGETTGSSSWGGPSGAGSGGAIVLQSAESIDVESGATFDVSSRGRDGEGLVQLQVPVGATVTMNGTIKPSKSWVDPTNELNPARFTPFSVAVSTWHDLGRTIIRGDGRSHPGFSFHGLDESGFVRTDEEGNVLDPRLANIECDYLGQLDPFRPGHYIDGQEPRADFIPPNASVQLLFQGAHAVTDGSKEIDPESITDWTADIASMMNHQFIRYRVRFDLAAEEGATASGTSPRPAVQRISIHTEF